MMPPISDTATPAQGHFGCGSEARCECGQLMAKLRQDGIELKCKRCRRIVLLPFAGIEGWSTDGLR